MHIKSLLIVICSLFYVVDGVANEADVVNVDVSKTSAATFRFNVTVLHQDTGWEHYVNKWDIVDLQGNILGTRILYHPHVNEQPFTRSLSDVFIPEKIKTVTVRAHNLIHEYGGKELTVKLP
jgi:hypothetical protein